MALRPLTEIRQAEASRSAFASPGEGVLVTLAFLAIVAFGAWLRLDAPDWDSFAGLHPDERFMVFRVEESLRGLLQLYDAPAWAQLRDLGTLLFDSAGSPLNPRNQTDGGSVAYVYGELPHLIATVSAWSTGVNGFENLLLQGRLITATVESLTVVLAFFIGATVGRSALTGLAAALFYAGLPIAVQTAHFFTVDPFLAFFCALALLGLVRAATAPTLGGWVLAGIGAGAALACKITAVFLAPAFLVALVASARSLRDALLGLVGLALALAAAAVTFRLTGPFAFAGPGFLDLSLEPRFVVGLEQIFAQSQAWPGAPSNWSWVDRTPVVYPLRDLALLGFGPGLALALALAGGARAILAAALLLGVIFIWRSEVTLADAPIPFEAFAALGTGALLIAARRIFGAGAATLVTLTVFAAMVLPMLAHKAPALRYALPGGVAAAALAALILARPVGRAKGALALACLALVAVQGDSVRRMLEAPHPRITASIWIWDNLPPGSLIVNETAWDDGLPVPLRRADGEGRLWAFVPIGPYRGTDLGLHDGPSPEKAERMATLLAEGDLIVESSTRMSGTLPRMDGFRPIAAAYYRERDAGRLCLEEVARFELGLPVLGLFEIDDSWAQEIWTVYDHPRVRLFRPLDCMNRATVAARLTEALTE